jgi:hypothetical protein
MPKSKGTKNHTDPVIRREALLESKRKYNKKAYEQIKLLKQLVKQYNITIPPQPHSVEIIFEE